MATFTYFYDTAEQVIELVSGVTTMDIKVATAKWPGVRMKKSDGYSVWVGCDANGVQWPTTRKIEMKRNPSKHICNAKCLNGSCHGTCECRCGGKNHGRGMFTQLVAA